ncbi:MAG: UDP-N-acetylmuramoyl-tripeptide--D-alanyl-D-alanine ligase [Nitrospirae bacterium]|nr:UDP-N-acetylmuramoyl-tripeptide--D-alanyl-D-alanine ligase [Nitrospirota bacterium]
MRPEAEARTVKFTLKDLMRATGGIFRGGRSTATFDGVSTDSRDVRSGALFFALSGPRFDGHRFVVSALKSGAFGAVIREGEAPSLRGPATAAREESILVEVSNPLDALGDLAQQARARFAGAVVGVTGSNGKTTTKEILRLLLGTRLDVGCTSGNFNNQIGLPRTLLGFSGDEKVWVLELGINQRGEMERLAAVASPTIGVITDLSESHLEGLESGEGVAEEKGRMFSRMGSDGVAVVPFGNPFVPVALRSFAGRAVTFGLDERADVHARNIRREGIRGARFELHSRGEKLDLLLPGGSTPVLLNTLAAIAAGQEAGLELGDVAAGIEKFTPVKGRLNVIEGRWTIVDDTYNANPASTIAALKFLKMEMRPGRTVCCLGDMKELGTASERWHRAIGREAATLGYGCIIAVGNMASWVAEGAKEGRCPPNKVFSCGTADEALDVLREQLRPGDGVLVKGSRAMAMERVVEGLKKMEEEIRGSSS